MSRIGERFTTLKNSGGKALVCFLTAGDPDIETTRRIVLEIEKAGADIVELGVPFSDPMADGKSIQESSMRALEKGTNVRGVLDLVKSLRTESEVPIILMTYYNPVLHYGLEKFASDAKEAGVDGMIITDLTPEESDEWMAVSRPLGIDTIFLLAPTSTDDRIKRVAKLANGFIYCVSRTGITGVRDAAPKGIRELVDNIHSMSSVPVAIGFGISRPEHVKAMCELADGVIIGSVLVNKIAAETGKTGMMKEIYDLVSSMKSGTE